MNRYRVLRPPPTWPEGLPFKIQTPEGTYKVIGDSDVFETKTGGTFDAALPMHPERLLIDGGFIERVEAPKPAPPSKPQTTKEK